MIDQPQPCCVLHAARRLSERTRFPASPTKKLLNRAWQIRHRGWLIARERPTLFYAFARRRGFPPDQLVGAHTQLVIEGFPRSANSYAVIGFQLAQPALLSLAHHTHAPAQIIRAVERNIPLMVPVRHPRDAIASLLIRDRRYSIGLAVDAYASFYRTVLPYRDALVLAPFDDLTRDLGSVVRRVNSKYGTSFALPPSSDDKFRNACFRQIEEIDRRTGGNESTVARPSAWRQERKRELVARIQNAERYPEILELYENAVAPRMTANRLSAIGRQLSAIG